MVGGHGITSNNAGICPAITLDATKVFMANMNNPDTFKIEECSKYGTTYHTLEFGEYPQNYVGDNFNLELEKIYQDKSPYTRKLKETGRVFPGVVGSSNAYVQNIEYEYNGKKYVRVFSVIDDADYVVRIPMYHGVDSLNVAAASAVAFWELRKR